MLTYMMLFGFWIFNHKLRTNDYPKYVFVVVVEIQPTYPISK